MALSTRGEHVKQRTAFQQRILLSGHLKAVLRQKSLDFVKAARLIVDLNSDLADQAPMLGPNSRQNVPFHFSRRLFSADRFA